MRTAFAGLLVVHGLIHLLGFAKAFGIGRVEALRLPVGPAAGILWLLAGLAFVVAGALFYEGSGWWSIPAAPALLLSQVLIVLAWPDAKFGTIANAIVLFPLAASLAQASPWSFQTSYERDAKALLASVSGPAPLVTERDLEPLPPLVAAYLRRVGVVGKPHVRGFQARCHGRIRNGLDAAFMDFTSDQHELVSPSERLFFLEASHRGVPFDGYHHFRGDEARMRVRLASLLTVADGRGEEMNQGETVTIFNDLCILAPAALLDVPVRFTTVDARSVRASFTRGKITISAVLTFDEKGDLVGFVSEDRFMSADGKRFERLPWSTPLRDHRDYSGVRLPGSANTVWKTPKGDFVYGEFHLDSITYL